MKKGRFIVFEGIDGCGKTTQIWILAEYISKLNKYNHILVTREPYKIKEIRKILQTKEEPEKHAKILTELFIKDREKHINSLINPNLKKGIYVISDRYKFSTIVYQSIQGIPIKKLIERHKGMPIPDITFIIDTPAEIAAERMKKDSRNEHKFENNLNFQRKLRSKYLEMQKYFPDENIIIINGAKTIKEIAEKIRLSMQPIL